MSHGPTTFEPKGGCIYCGSTDVVLTDEHIVPYALGGQHVLREASCGTCAVHTGLFERKIARELWGDARNSFNAPSRRKRNRSQTIQMPDADSPGQTISVPTSEYPAGFVFYKMGLPGILQGLPEDTDISGAWKLIMIDDEQRRESFLRQRQSKLVLKFRHVPREFGQLLCKIAHGQLLTSLALNDFDPIAVPYILGQKTNVSYLVGGVPGDTKPSPNVGYSLTSGGIIISPHRMLLTVNIRLYANTFAPEYLVVGGEVTGQEQIQSVLKKLLGS